MNMKQSKNISSVINYYRTRCTYVINTLRFDRMSYSLILIKFTL